VALAVTAGIALGLLLAWAWSYLPRAAGLGLALLLLAVATAVGARLLRQARRRSAEETLQQEHLTQLERRARQFAVAEQLVAVSSFDWYPLSGDLHWSDQHYRLWGYEPGAVTPSLELFRRHVHPDDAASVDAALQQALQGQAPYDCRHRVLRSDGSVRHVHARGQVDIDAEGRGWRMIGALVDVSDQMRTQAEQRVVEFVLDAITDTVSAIDDNLHYRIANRAWLQAFGWRRDQVLGRPLQQVFPHVVSPQRRAAMLSCLTEDRVITVRGPSPSALQPDRILETRYFPFHDPSAAWRGTVMVSRDVTEDDAMRTALAAAEARQGSLMEAFPGYIWVVGADFRVLYLNPAAAAIYQPVVVEPGMAAERLFPPVVYTHVRPMIERALDGQTQSIEWHSVAPGENNPADLLVKLVPGTAPDGQRACFAFGLDISSLKQAEAALLAAKDEAERANQAKTQFLSAMSHELRTPLNAVIGFSQVLELDSNDSLSERQRRQVGEIHRAGKHLLALINDLLDLARIEAGHTTLELSPVALPELFDECLQLVRPLAEHQSLSLQPAPEAAGRVLAHRMRLKQVLLNLLSNAIKYNREGGRVVLHCRRDGAQVMIEIEDEGPGLSAEAQARLFQPYERLDADATDVVGTGIGLALSSQLMQLMQGSIGVRSAPGQGSCFWLRLPACEAAAHAPPAAETAMPAPPAATRVLYLDDNPVNLALMEGLFEERPLLRLRTLDDPQLALQTLPQQPVDLLLVDLQMPVLDGFEVLARLRADPATRALPVIAVSADATPQTVERCRRLGFADHIAKPIDAARLFAAVDRALATAAPAAPTPTSS
jgi:signal transduction histidine kinase/CheY-like chemotaxis protein